MTDYPEKDADWRFEYPWGRKHPTRRIAELEERRSDIRRREILLRERFAERLIDFERQMQAVNADLETARLCETDRVRRLTLSLAYRLLDFGIDRVDFAREANGDVEAYRCLVELMREAKRRHREEPKDPDIGYSVMGGEEDDGFINPDYLDETIVDISDIEAEQP